VLIQGKPGLGEKAFCQKLAYDWATGRQKGDYLPTVETVLLLRCRDMKSGLWEAIDDQLLPRDVGEDLREGFVEFVCQKRCHGRVLLILDGLDEVPPDKLPELLGVLPECRVVATAHEPKITVTKHFDALLEIKAFSEEEAEELIVKLLPNLRSNENLKDMAANPLNTALLCLISKELQGISPENKTELYMEITRCILRRSRNQRGLPETSDDLIQKVNETLLKHLGSIALNGLVKDTLDFEQSELGSHADDFFTSFQAQGSEQRRHQRYSFLHKKFQQWFAAFNLYCQLIEEEIHPDDLFTGIYAKQLNGVLPFTCGLLAARCKETAITLIESITKQVNTETTDAQPSETSLPKPWTLQTQSTIGALKCIKEMSKLSTFQRERLILALECIKECREDLGPKFGSFLQLQTLPLQDHNVSVAHVDALANSLKWNKTVTDLNLSGNNIDDAGAAALADVLRCNTILTKLNLSGNNISETGAKVLSDALKCNSTMTELNLSHNNIGDDGTTGLADALKCNSTLTELNLSHNNIGDDGATWLADALKCNSTLTELNLSHNNIGDDGASGLADVLKPLNTTLKGLNLSSNDVRDAGAVSLADALENNRILSQLNLHGNNYIGKDAYVRLSTETPSGRVFPPSPDEMVL